MANATQVAALIITGHGVNCEEETAHAARQAGADTADIVFFSDIEAGRVRLADYNFLCFPGGFLDGDDLGAAHAAAQRWRHGVSKSGESLLDQLRQVLDNGGVMLGICNGFQLLVKLGLLPALDGQYFTRQVSLSNNDSARFEDRWVRLKANPDSPCVFTRGLSDLYFPVRHGEGKLITMDEAMLDKLVQAGLIALQYVDEKGEPTEVYPANPNGSPLGVAGLTDPTGRILGLMPHPECFNHPTNHPGWTRGESAVLGTELFANGVRYLRRQ